MLARLATGIGQFSRLTASLACASALAYWLLHHPTALLAGLIVGGYGLIIAIRPGWWLVLLPALWPVADLTLWTGRMYFTETDALVLVTIGLLLARPFAPAQEDQAPPRFRPQAIGVALICLLVASYALSMARGFDGWSLAPGQLLDVGYHTPWNSPRVTKGFVLALALMPVVLQTLRRGGDQALQRLFAGMILALCSASLAVLWERAAFPGITDFSSDYRTTGLFWEMHVGGAALDGWLALTLPFLIVAFFKAQRIVVSATLLGLGSLGAYAVFTTFSRGLYAAAAAITLLLLAFLLSQRRQVDSIGSKHERGAEWLLGLVTCVGSVLAFSHGGYRGMAACLGFATLVYLGAPSCARLLVGQQIASWVCALLLTGISLLTAELLPKGAYVAYGLSWIATLALILSTWKLGERGSRSMLVLAGLLWTGMNAILVGGHWGGDTALPSTIAANAPIAAILALQPSRAQPLWSASYRNAISFLAVAGIAGIISVFTASYYVGARFSTVALDLAGRMKHWSDSVALVQAPMQTALGIGTGRFADAYFWQTPGATYPGTWEILDRDGVRFLRLGAPRHTLGFGELFRVSQRVARNVEGAFAYRIEVRAPGKTALHLELCRKHLLYADHCAGKAVPVEGEQWHTLEGQLDTGNLTPSAWYLPRPTVFSLSSGGGNPVEIRDIELTDNKGHALLKNGRFGSGADYWFFSSDRHHLPWHAKNLWVHLYVEQGVLGIVAVGAAVLAALLRLATKRRYRDAAGAALLTGLVGFMVVGLFDSLLDVPRLTTFFFLVVWLALCLDPPHVSARAKETARNRGSAT
jgi:hypothetical protein